MTQQSTPTSGQSRGGRLSDRHPRGVIQACQPRPDRNTAEGNGVKTAGQEDSELESPHSQGTLPRLVRVLRHLRGWGGSLRNQAGMWDGRREGRKREQNRTSTLKWGWGRGEIPSLEGPTEARASAGTERDLGEARGQRGRWSVCSLPTGPSKPAGVSSLSLSLPPGLLWPHRSRWAKG